MTDQKIHSVVDRILEEAGDFVKESPGDPGCLIHSATSPSIQWPGSTEHG